jgi:hypothetical protein
MFVLSLYLFLCNYISGETIYLLITYDDAVMSKDASASFWVMLHCMMMALCMVCYCKTFCV